MKKWISLLLALILSLSLMAGGATAENAEESAEAAKAPVEDLVVLQHSAVVQGQTLHYTTTTGILPVKTEGGTCEIFFMAYTLDGVDDLSARPVTFAYNGGPGSSSEFVHMGFLAPRRIAFDENGNVQDFPAQITDNEYFDHVFINEETAKNFQFTRYPCGHMIYMQEDCLAQFRREAEAWYAK